MEEEIAALVSAIADSQHTIDLVLSNQYEAAKEFIRPKFERSIYHAHSYATIMFIEAAVGFDQNLTEEVTAVITRACHMARRSRRSFSSASASSLSEVAVHAELIHAELLLERALLTFLQDDGLLTFVHAAFRVREAYSCFRECWKLLKHRVWPPASESLRIHFECGVKLSAGVFNLLLSMLPKRILRMLEFIGFSGDKELGERLLREAAGPECANSVRSSMASMAALMYFLYLKYSVDSGNRSDIDLCRSIIKRFLDRYPKSAFFKYIVGRLSAINGRIEQAMVELDDSIEVQSVWRHLHLAAYWELLWCHTYQCDWLLAMKTAEHLERESPWSRSVFMYMQAIFMYTLALAPQPALVQQSALALSPSASQSTPLSSSQLPQTTAKGASSCGSAAPSNGALLLEEHELKAWRLRIEQLLNDLPAHTKRIAGKSLPSEKFVVSRAARYRERGGTLTLPAIELMYLWPTFRPLATRQALAENLLDHVEATLQLLEPLAQRLERQQQPARSSPKKLGDSIHTIASPYFWDEYALAMLLKGALLRTLRRTMQARICLSEVTTHLAPRVQHDRHVIVCAHLELAHVLMDSASFSAAATSNSSASGELDAAAVEAELTEARERYSHYLFESRLQFRVRGAQYRLLAIRDGKSGASSDDENQGVDGHQNNSDTAVEVFPELSPVQSVCASANGESAPGEMSAFLNGQADGMQFADEDAFVDAPEATPSSHSTDSS